MYSVHVGCEGPLSILADIIIILWQYLYTFVYKCSLVRGPSLFSKISCKNVANLTWEFEGKGMGLHLYKQEHLSPEIFSSEKISGLRWESNPHLHISGVMLYQLSYQALLGARLWGVGYTSENLVPLYTCILVHCTCTRGNNYVYMYMMMISHNNNAMYHTNKNRIYWYTCMIPER